jgi:3D (Asp-Asp-Asp) domain-containing protein
VASCGKARSNKNFGKTRSGYNLANKSHSEAMTIAADLDILPMGTKVYIEFKNARVSKYNGVYTVRDTGGAIHGYKLDLYIGDDAYQEAMDFGVQRAYVRVVE